MSSSWSTFIQIYLLTQLGRYPVAAVQYTFTHKQYTEQNYETEYPERNTHKTIRILKLTKEYITLQEEYIIYKIKQKHTKHTTICTIIQDIYIYIYIDTLLLQTSLHFTTLVDTSLISI